VITPCPWLPTTTNWATVESAVSAAAALSCVKRDSTRTVGCLSCGLQNRVGRRRVIDACADRRLLGPRTAADHRNRAGHVATRWLTEPSRSPAKPPRARQPRSRRLASSATAIS
jgi:hypothetical protein